MTTPAPARIFGIVAREANQAIILRRGPNMHTQLLVWDLDSDTVTPGQWIKGNVYVRKFDVSPNGKYMIGAFTNYSASFQRMKGPAEVDPGTRSAWTAISRPPYFTAIGLWWNIGTYSGGGIWRDNSKVEIESSWELDQQKLPGPPIEVSRLDSNLDHVAPLYAQLLNKRGWERVEQQIVESNQDSIRVADLYGSAEFGLESFEEAIPPYWAEHCNIWERPFERGIVRTFDASLLSQECIVLDDKNVVHKRWKSKSRQPQWIDLDGAGNLIFAENGCLWRWSDFPTGEPKMIADLNTNQFENVAPPDWAKVP